MHIAVSSENRIVFESNTHRAVVSKMLGNEKTPQWLLTAYEKKNTSGGSSDIVPEPKRGKQNGTAPLQDNSSTDKVTESAPSTQENRSKNSTQSAIESASADVNTDPTEVQKEAGNYKKGHVQVGSFDIKVQSGLRTDDNSGSEGGKDSEGEVRTRDEDSDESEATSEESGNGASENVRKPNFSRRERTAGRSNERQGDSAENGELTEEKKVLQDKVIGWLSDENIEWAEGKDFKEVIEHFGNIPEPIAAMPQIVRKNVQSLDADYLYCGKAYMIDHQANHHPELDKTNTSIFRQFLTVMTISRICLMVVI